jgi:hypothetical protein
MRALMETDLESGLKHMSQLLVDNRRIVIKSDKVLCVRVNYMEEKQLPRMVFLSHLLLTLTKEEPISFDGAIAWFKNLETDNPFDLMMINHLEKARVAEGQERRLLEAPGWLFESSELDLAVGTLVQSFLFWCDMYVVPKSGRYLAYKSHDEFVLIATNKADVFEQMLGDLRLSRFAHEVVECPWFLRKGQQ